MYLYCKHELEHERNGGKKSFTSLLDLLVNANIDVKVETKVTNGICKVLGSLTQMSESLQVEWTQRIAENIARASSHEAQTFLPVLFDLIISIIQLPPARLRDDNEHPKLSFSVIESALYSFTVLARKAPEWWDSWVTSDNKRRLDDRLRYLMERTKHHIQMWEQTYEAFAHTSVLTQGGATQKKLVSVALKAGGNIMLLAKNLLQRMPDLSESLINKVKLSFFKDKDSTKVPETKPEDQDNLNNDRDKRKRLPETSEDSSKKQKSASDLVKASKVRAIQSPVDVPASVILPPASPVSPQGSPVTVSLADLPQVWKGNLGKGDATVCSIGAKLVVGPTLNNDWVQVLHGTPILAVKDRTPIGDLTSYMQLGKHDVKPRRLSVLNFYPEQTQDQSAFVEFIQYLKSKDRAGIVRLAAGKMMYIVPTSPLATLLLDLNPSLATELRGTTNVLLGVVEAELEKTPAPHAPAASPPTAVNPLAFPFMQFPPHMLNMANMPAGMEGVTLANFPTLSNFPGLPMNMFPFVMQNLPQLPQIPTPPPDKNL